MPEPITSLTAAELARRYRDGSLDPVTVTEAYLAAIEAHPEGGKVYRVVTAQRALKQARAAKRRFDEGLRVSPMQGVPIAIKDLVGTAGDVTAAGSRVLGERPAEVEDAPVAARLDAAGAVFLGKTNMTELAYSGIGANPHYGTPGCALDPSRIPGGSSSGSGVAVASQLAAVAVGSDTGGSVRIPAAVNGIVGLKVTDGRIPTDGCAALSTTLDTIGPLARTAEDAWALYLAMTAEPHRPLAQAPARLTLLAPTTLLTDDLDDATLTGFEQGLARLEALGHHVRREPLPILMEAPAAYSRFGSFASHEVWALYQDLFESRRHDFDPHVADRVYLYANRPSSDYIRLNYARADFRRRFWPSLSGVDAVVGPTIPHVPVRIAEVLTDDEAYHRENNRILRNTAPFNVLGSPAVSVPVATTVDGLSIGLMIVTRPLEEELALGVARALELQGA
ncbi:MAG: amidase [Trueperaceae bacterium]|nr:amidase [Trueperaceae bacterium]MCO5175076.1 amidase [Trueperaceae bacterium]